MTTFFFNVCEDSLEDSKFGKDKKSQRCKPCISCRKKVAEKRIQNKTSYKCPKRGFKTTFILK